MVSSVKHLHNAMSAITAIQGHPRSLIRLQVEAHVCLPISNQ